MTATHAGKELAAISLREMTTLMYAWRQPSYRAKQVIDWRNRGVLDPAAMHNLPSPLRALLSQDLQCHPLRLARRLISVDGTRKYLFALASGQQVETVFIPEADRGTVCLSTQAGCVFDCPFCHTGTQPFRGNLSAGEIVAQLLAIKQDLKSHPPSAGTGVVTHVVYMGMGEPLANEASLHASLGLLLDRHGLGLSRRRVTVSTSGLIPAIERLGRAFPVNLAVSLHAADDALRDQLVPINRKYPLARLRACLDAYPLGQQRHITLEYVMLKGVNDDAKAAAALAAFVRPGRERVNLIPFNPYPSAPFQGTPEAEINAFARRLIRHGIRATVRSSRGQDIMAACGQLKAASGKE